jgi:putative colanic acid biosynthesis acetyltransferase WcaF
MLTDTARAARKPYAWWTYPARGLWQMVQASVWRLAWRRLDFLRPAILRSFGARVPPRSLICGSVRVYFPWALRIGVHSAISERVTFYNLGGVTLGDRVVISQDVYFCGGTHDYSLPAYPLQRKAISVEDDVWIGAGAFIGPGVKIGQGAVVGARAVVFKDVPPWKVVVGNPARVIKDRVLRTP